MKEFKFKLLRFRPQIVSMRGQTFSSVPFEVGEAMFAAIRCNLTLKPQVS